MQVHVNIRIYTENEPKMRKKTRGSNEEIINIGVLVQWKQERYPNLSLILSIYYVKTTYTINLYLFR